MSAQLLSSKIVIVEEEPRIRSIVGVPTAVVGAVGIAERGPIGQAVRVTSFEEYEKIFGSFTVDADLTIAAYGFFLNGGEQFIAVRTCHYSDITNPTAYTAAKGTRTLQTVGGPTKGSVTSSNAGPYNLEPGDTLIVATDITPAGTTITFLADAASLENASAETYALANGQTLDVKVDGGAVQTITFLTAEFVAIGAATAEEVAAVINAKMSGGKAFTSTAGTKVTIESDKQGTGSGIEVTGGTANAALGFSTAPVAGTGNVADINNVLTSEVAALVTALADVTASVNGLGRLYTERDTAGATFYVEFMAASSADAVIGLDNLQHFGTGALPVDTLRGDGKTPGAYTGSLSLRIENATSGKPEEFNLAILKEGVVKESFANLDMDTVEALVNSVSDLLEMFDLAAPGTLLQRRPANGTSATLTGGNDGLIGIVDIDFIGNQAAQNGIYALDLISDLSLLIVPGKGTAAIHNGMISYCEVVRAGSVFAVLDPPSGLGADGVVTYVESTAALLELTEYAAIYWPWIKIVNPSKNVFGDTDDIVVAPSGFVVGVYARTDGSQPGGVYLQPAGVDVGQVFGCIGFETTETEDERKRDLVYPKRINPITTERGLPRYIDGSRTLKSTGNFPSVGERRGVIYIEFSLKRGLAFVKHKNHTPALRATVRRSAYAFLITQMRNNAFASTEPAKAFFVDVSEALNPPSVVYANQLIARIGLATAKPTEWVILKFVQDTRALEEELAG